MITNKYSVIKFLKQYAELFPLAVEMLSFVDGHYVRLPFNFETVQQLAGPEKAENLLAKLRAAFTGRDRVPVLELVDYSDPDISNYGNLLFEKAYRTYTSKMWGIQPEQIDKYVLDRVPMAMGYDKRYLNKDFQYLPVQIVSYPQAEGYTRSTEYRKIMYNDSGVRGSVVATEYPLAYDPTAQIGNIPYYPVVTEGSEHFYQQYLEEADQYRNLFLCGRLAEFKYYNMDVCIEHALAYFEDVRNYLSKCRD